MESEDIDLKFRTAALPSRRVSRRQQALVGQSAEGDVIHSDVKTYYRVTNFYPSMDMIVTELKNRFSENEQDILCALEALVFDKDIPVSDFFTVL